jgi:hypothetical protein
MGPHAAPNPQPTASASSLLPDHFVGDASRVSKIERGESDMAESIAWTEAWERAVLRAWKDPQYKLELLSNDIARVRAALKEIGYEVHPGVKSLVFRETGKELDVTADSADQFFPPGKPTDYEQDVDIVITPLPNAPPSFALMARRDPDFLC